MACAGSVVGIGDDAMGEASGEAVEELLVRPLLELRAVTDDDRELIDASEVVLVEEQRDPQRDPDSRRWLSM